MSKPLATAAQCLRTRLVNRKPVVCAVCHRWVPTFGGLPVILDVKENLIEFIHPACRADGFGR